MKPGDLPKMDNPAVAFYLLGLSEALSTFACGVYPRYVPDKVRNMIEFLTDYFYLQLPDDGFKVLKPNEYMRGQ